MGRVAQASLAGVGFLTPPPLRTWRAAVLIAARRTPRLLTGMSAVCSRRQRGRESASSSATAYGQSPKSASRHSSRVRVHRHDLRDANDPYVRLGTIVGHVHGAGTVADLRSLNAELQRPPAGHRDAVSGTAVPPCSSSTERPASGAASRTVTSRPYPSIVHAIRPECPLAVITTPTALADSTG